MDSAPVVGAAAFSMHCQTPAAATASTTPATSSATRVAIINIQAAILNSHEGSAGGQQAVTGLRNQFGPKRAQLQQRQDELQALQVRLTKAGATLSDAAKEKLAGEIQSKTRTLKRDAEDLDAEATEAQNKMGKQLGPKMYAVVEKYASQRGCHVVLDASNPQAPVYWADSSAVITGDLVMKYDVAHPPKAAAADNKNDGQEAVTERAFSSAAAPAPPDLRSGPRSSRSPAAAWLAPQFPRGKGWAAWLPVLGRWHAAAGD
jgi:Skp family chaperone for outer membrane proteins